MREKDDWSPRRVWWTWAGLILFTVLVWTVGGWLFVSLIRGMP